MRRISPLVIVATALTVMLLAPTPSQTQGPTARQPQVATRITPEQQAAITRTVTTQQRINRHFHDSVMPKLRGCWSSIKGRGTVQIEHTYTKDAGGRWTAGKLAVTGSTLPAGQADVALRCMQDSVRDSWFAAEGRESSSKEYVVSWTWPVPFPTDATEQTRKMFLAVGTGAGLGCDGKGAPAQCYNCKKNKDATSFSCVKVCVGYKNCSLTFGEQGLGCSLGTECASGGPFGVGSRGSIIY